MSDGEFDNFQQTRERPNFYVFLEIYVKKVMFRNSSKNASLVRFCIYEYIYHGEFASLSPKSPTMSNHYLFLLPMPQVPDNTYNSSQRTLSNTTEATFFNMKKNCHRSQINQPAERITLKVRIVGKPSTFERMNPWSNRPYIS